MGRSSLVNGLPRSDRARTWFKPGLVSTPSLIKHKTVPKVSRACLVYEGVLSLRTLLDLQVENLKGLGTHHISGALGTRPHLVDAASRDIDTLASTEGKGLSPHLVVGVFWVLDL